MRKLFTISLVPVFAFLLLGTLVAVPANAQAPTESCTIVRNINTTDPTVSEGDVVGPVLGGGPPAVTVATDKWGTICLINTVNVIVDWIFLFLIVLAVAFIAIAGFMWMTGRGEPEKQKAAGQMIAAALIGIVIAILARVLPAVITGILL